MLQKIRAAIAGLGPAVKASLPSSASLARVMPVVLLAVALTAMAMMWMWRQDAAYKPLFGVHEDVPVAEALAALDGERIPYRLHPQSGQILVAADRMGAARMMLAARGVAARLPEGLEQVDRSDPLGVSQFVQDVRFRRGLEGELTRSIASLEPVESAICAMLLKLMMRYPR